MVVIYILKLGIICVGQKRLEGWGFRNSKDMNEALVSKMAWQEATNPHNPWALLIRAKYLRGRNILNLKISPIRASWIWQSIRGVKGILQNRLYFKFRPTTELDIWSDPFLPGLQGFKLDM